MMPTWRPMPFEEVSAERPNGNAAMHVTFGTFSMLVHANGQLKGFMSSKQHALSMEAYG